MAVGFSLGKEKVEQINHTPTILMDIKRQTFVPVPRSVSNMKVQLGRFLGFLRRIWSGFKLAWKAFTVKGRAVLEEVGDATGILAIRLLANRTLHWTERLMWLSLILWSIFLAYLLSSKQLKRYVVSPTVVSLDRDYRGWRGTMPAVTLCYYDHLDSFKANEYIQARWNVSIIDEEYFYFMEFLYAVVNATASNYVDLVRFAEDERFEDLDLGEAISAIDRPFEQLLVSFNPWFKINVNPVMTERGRCYAINSPISSILDNKADGIENLNVFEEPLVCEFGKQQCFIKMDIFESTGTIDVHSAYEVSASNGNIIPLRKSDEVIAYYKVLETVASDKLRQLTPKQRKCIFPDEDTSTFPIYTKTLCLARCRAVMALEMCNCVPFFYPYVEGPSCNPTGFECLLDFKWPVWALHICNCPNTCTEMEYTLQSIKRRSWGGKEKNRDIVTSTFRWEVSPPKVRMRRDVLFGFEDLLVSFGGTLALFLGFSVLSIVQICNVLIYNCIQGIFSAIHLACGFLCAPLLRFFSTFRARNRVNTIRKQPRKTKGTDAQKTEHSPPPYRYLE